MAGHTAFKHCVYASVNSAYINGVLNAETIAFMPRQPRTVHASFQRLLDYARRATAGKKNAVVKHADLGRRLNVSPQTLNNWVTRGVSMEGALIAQRKLGCSADWVLDGQGSSEAVHAPPPPANPPKDFSSKHRVTPSEWQLLSDIEAFPKEDREALLQELHAKAEKYRAYAREVIERIGSGAKD